MPAHRLTLDPALGTTQQRCAVLLDEGDGAPAPGAAALPGPGAHTGPGARRSLRREVLEWVLISIAAFTVAVLVRATTVQAFYIPSESMVPTLRVDDRVLVDKLSYRFSPISRGDIVVFERRLDAAAATKDLVKRVVAVGGDTVEAREGVLWVNGRPLSEPYLRLDGDTQNLELVTVPADHLWVMGDNRSNSADSRVFGPVPNDLVVGRVRLRVWPPGRIGTP